MGTGMRTTDGRRKTTAAAMESAAAGLLGVDTQSDGQKVEEDILNQVGSLFTLMLSLYLAFIMLRHS